MGRDTGMRQYLSATYFLDYDHAAIQEKSRELTVNVGGAKERAIRLFYFVKDENKPPCSKLQGIKNRKAVTV
jgi:hypothetical protein